MNKLGEHIPTAWIWLIPFVGGIWWYWQYSQGVAHVTHDKMSGVLAFVILFSLGGIGQAITQDSFNNIDNAIPAPESPASPQTSPVASPTMPSSPSLPTQSITPTFSPTTSQPLDVATP